MTFRSLIQSIRIRLEPVLRRRPRPTVTKTVCQPQVQQPAAANVRLTAVELLRIEPNLTPAELAERAAVSLSYANSLVRKQRRSQPVKQAAKHPAPTPIPAPIPVRPAAAGETPTRVRILEMAAAGKTTADIAQALNIAPGEVEFVIKVSRLRKIA